MTVLAFVVGVVLLLAALLVYETSADTSLPRLRQYGLVAWLSTGNWPAKIGAVLLLIGFGALIRYVLQYANVPPEIKLGSGIALSALLGAAAYALRERPNQRAVYLGLAGAAHGVA